MNTYDHSTVSVDKYGGVRADYHDIHDLMDCTKAFCNHNGYRLFHTQWSIHEIIIPIFGQAITNSDGQEVSVESICLDHARLEYGRDDIPQLSDFVEAIRLDADPAFIKKLDNCFSQFSNDPAIIRILLSPLLYTNQVKSLVLTLNSWFLGMILPKLVPAMRSSWHCPYSGEAVFTSMQYRSWMEPGPVEQKMTHIIRKIAYHHDGHCFSKHVEGGIIAAFENYGKALAVYEYLEYRALRACCLDEYAPIGSSDMYADTREQLHQYMTAHFNLELLVPAQKRQTLHKRIKIPDTATDNQVAEISKLSRIAFYNLSSFEQTPSFYVIETCKPFFQSEGVISRAGAPIFFNTYEDAAKNLSNHLEDFTICGRPEDLTDTPAIFQYLVDNENCFIQDSGRETVQVGMVPGLVTSGLLALVDCLKEKPFRIRKISVEAVRHIDHKVYEQ
jgi:hypothetical protein